MAICFCQKIQRALLDVNILFCKRPHTKQGRKFGLQQPQLGSRNSLSWGSWARGRVFQPRCTGVETRWAHLCPRQCILSCGRRAARAWTASEEEARVFGRFPLPLGIKHPRGGGGQHALGRSRTPTNVIPTHREGACVYVCVTDTLPVFSRNLASHTNFWLEPRSLVFLSAHQPALLRPWTCLPPATPWALYLNRV